MKRLTLLTMLVALLSVTAFAQKKARLLLQPRIEARTGVQFTPFTEANSLNKALRRAGDVVTPPSGLVTEDYTITAKFTDNSGDTDVTRTIKIGIDGSDVYIQGLSVFVENAWIKGRLNVDKTQISIPSPQYYGAVTSGNTDIDIYFIYNRYVSQADDTYPTELVLGYDAATGAITLPSGSGTYFLEGSEAVNAFKCYGYSYISNIKKVSGDSPQVVVAPEGLQTDEWAISATDNYGDIVSGYVNIGFNGNDVYLQGLNTYLPEAWIKGTLDGTTITFAGDQYFGYYNNGASSSYDFFLCNEGIIFTYDATAGKLTAEGEVYIYTGGSNLKGDVYNNPVITKVDEKAGTPSTPVITEIYESAYGPIAMFNIPPFDVEGNAMLSSKLSFQFFKDIDEEVSAVTFEPADYMKLKETMTVIPYGFTDKYDFYPTYIYMNQKDFSQWNKIGIQTIYTGGGVDNKSEIFWFELKPYAMVSFDFNAMDVACSSKDSDAGDITADLNLEANGVMLTVSPSTTSTPNRFWSTNKGPQLRVYSGTLTFEAPVGKVLTKIVFNNVKWNDGNSADSGTFDGATWTGEAKTVVVTIAGNTQLNSIDVYPTDYVATPVEAPEELTTETYIFKATAVEATYDPADAVAEPYSLQVKVGFDGNDAYIQGLVYDAPELWAKATKNEAGQYVIPANQFMGILSVWGGMFTFNYYFTAVDAEGKMVDAVFDYDAEKSLFTTSQTLMLNESQTELAPYITFTNVTIEKFVEVAATPADPTFEAINFDDTYPSIYCSLATEGTNGEVVNLDKLYYTVWIEKNGEQKPYTFTAAAYGNDFDEDVTEIPYKYDGYDLYYGGEIIYFEEELEELCSWSRVGIQTIYYGAGECRKSNIVWMVNGAFLPTEITVNKNGYATFYDDNFSIVIPEGVKAYVVTEATTEKLTYTEIMDVIPAGTAVLLEAKAGTYPIVISPENVTYDGVNLLYGTNVPVMTYSSDDNCLFYKLAYGYSGGPNANKLGWYWGAENGEAFMMEAHHAWLAIPQIAASAPGYPFGSDITGISTMKVADSADGVFYDLQGRRINTPAKGLYINKNKKVIIK